MYSQENVKETVKLVADAALPVCLVNLIAVGVELVEMVAFGVCLRV